VRPQVGLSCFTIGGFLLRILHIHIWMRATANQKKVLECLHATHALYVSLHEGGMFLPRCIFLKTSLFDYCQLRNVARNC